LAPANARGIHASVDVALLLDRRRALQPRQRVLQLPQPHVARPDLAEALAQARMIDAAVLVPVLLGSDGALVPGERLAVLAQPRAAQAQPQHAVSQALVVLAAMHVAVLCSSDRALQPRQGLDEVSELDVALPDVAQADADLRWIDPPPSVTLLL